MKVKTNIKACGNVSITVNANTDVTVAPTNTISVNGNTITSTG